MTSGNAREYIRHGELQQMFSNHQGREGTFVRVAQQGNATSSAMGSCSMVWVCEATEVGPVTPHNTREQELLKEAEGKAKFRQGAAGNLVLPLLLGAYCVDRKQTSGFPQNATVKCKTNTWKLYFPSRLPAEMQSENLRHHIITCQFFGGATFQHS